MLSERDFNADDRDLAEELVLKVALPREDKAQWIDTLEELRVMNGEDWFKNTFSDKFWETVDKWREEWINADDTVGNLASYQGASSPAPTAAFGFLRQTSYSGVPSMASL